MQKIKNLIKKYPYISAITLVFVIILAVLFTRGGGDKAVAEIEESARTVNTVSVSDYASGAVGFFAPTAAGNAFVVRAESGGRVESVAESGVVVEKGTVLAELENSSQRAALTQAQGAYETAVASAEQSSFSVDSSTETLTSSYTTGNTTLHSTQISVQGVMENTVNTFFTDRNRQSLELTDYFWEKKLLDYALDDWNEAVTAGVSDAQLVSELETAISVTQRVATLLDVIFDAVLDEENGASDSDLSTLSGYKTTLTAAKSTIASDLQSLKAARLSIIDAESSLQRAEASSLGGTTSAEEARIKTALGSLQAAQSAYEKTIVRAPFAGTVTSLNVGVGDVISVGTDVAIIEPESDAETDQSFTLPLSAVKYTPTGAYVFTVNSSGTLETTEVETGLVTTSMITVTGLTGSEVIIEDVRGLKAGEQVEVN